MSEQKVINPADLSMKELESHYGNIILDLGMTALQYEQKRVELTAAATILAQEITKRNEAFRAQPIHLPPLHKVDLSNEKK